MRGLRLVLDAVHETQRRQEARDAYHAEMQRLREELAELSEEA